MTVRTVVHLFAGSGGCTLGFKRAGFTSLGSFDFDPAACRDLERLTGGPAFEVDLAAMEPAELRQRTGSCPDVVVMSPPCLPADGRVMTASGPRRIDTIAVGDLVLSHKGRYCNVAKINTRLYEGRMYGLRLNGTVDVDTQWYTAEHPLWVRRVVRGTDKVRTLRQPNWTPAQRVRAGDRVGFPVVPERAGTAEEFVCSFGNPRVGPTRLLGRVVDLREHATSPAMWALLGAYLGDGDRNANGRYTVRWAVGALQGETYNLVVGALMALGLKFYVEVKNERNVRVCANSRHLWLLCGRLGSSSLEKTIPEELMGLEAPLLAALINGLRMTDGHEHGGGVWSIASISLPLLRGVQRLMMRFSNYGGIHRVLRAGRGVIEGREVNISDSYRIMFYDKPAKTCYKFEDGVAWLRVKAVHERDALEPVWNLEVDEDDTYCSPLIATHNCKSYSGCMPAARAGEARYVDMSQLAIRGMFLALEAWAPARPKLVILENVPRIQTRGAALLAQIVGLLHASGYAVDQRVHDCGELGGLAQRRQRFLLVARDMRTCPDFLRLPQQQRVRAVGEVLGPLPSPVAEHGDELHRLPQLSPLNWLRLAAIRAGKDWRDLPAAIVIGGDASERHQGKMGVEAWGEAAHTVIARGARVGSTWASVADPRLADRAARQNGGFGVELFDEPAHAILGEGTVRNTRASVADPRVAWDPDAHGGRPDSWGVGEWDRASPTIRAQSKIQTSRVSVADPRLACVPRSGAYGVLDDGAPSGTVIGHHKHDNGPASVADPRLDYSPRRGTLGVMESEQPAPTIRASHSVRQAPAAVDDRRGWPEPTHFLEREGDVLVLYGPALDLASAKSCTLVIRAPDGTWHRPLTDRELAVLQGFPVDCFLEGPSSSSKKKVGRREHIGNAIPPPTAEAIARECLATLEAAEGGLWRLGGGGVWVQEATAL